MDKRVPYLKLQNGICLQRGAVLAAVLMIVLVVTILGVTALNSASLEGKLAYNFQERALAFQAAEQALIDGEQYLNSLVAEPEPCETPPCVIWARNTLQSHSGSPNYMWWEFHKPDWWVKMGATTTMNISGGTGGYYLIEERSFVQNNAQANTAGSGLNYYTVTALGTRAASGAVVVLQSHYMKRFN